MSSEMVKDGHLGGYFRGGDPGTWCPNMWSWIIEEFSVRSVLDIGCGEGQSTRFFHERGCDVVGIDGSQKAIDNSVIPACVVKHDFCDGPYVPDRKSDLIWACEFLEHVEERNVPNILETFATSTNLVLVTHAFPGQDRGHHHVNCQPSAYWIRKIESIGFACNTQLTLAGRTKTLQDYPSINHFARSGLIFVRSKQASQHPVAAASPWKPRWKAARINWGFKISSAYRTHRRRRRAQKRQLRRKQTAQHHVT